MEIILNLMHQVELGRFIFVVVNNKLKPNLFPMDFAKLFFNLLL